MVKCEECNEEFDGFVCKNCGLVSEEKELVSFVPRSREEDRELSWSHQLSPSLEFQNLQPKSSTNKELNRALFWQKRKKKKSDDDYYLRAYNDIKAKCTLLRLPLVIKMEGYNMAKNLIKKNQTFFTYGRCDYRYLAIIKIACKINNIHVDERELVKSCKYYDNSPLNMRNSPIKKNIDREIMIIKKLLKLYIKRPKIPIFLSHACNVLNISQEEETNLFNIYKKIHVRFNMRFKLEGYILALIYLNCKKHKIGLGKLEAAFGVARDTIRNRKKEIEVMLNAKKKTKSQI